METDFLMLIHKDLSAVIWLLFLILLISLLKWIIK